MKKDQTFIRSLKGWISGNAGLQEERELQQLAQDDPFLADALDGYQSTAGVDHEQHLQKLRKRLAGKEEKRRGFPILLRVAAGGAILIAALFALQLVNSGASDQIGEAVPATESVEDNAAPSVEQDEVVAEQEATSPAEEEEQAEVTPSKPAPAVAAKDMAKTQREGQPRKKTASPTQVAVAKEKKPTVAEEESRDERIASAELDEKIIVFEDSSIPSEAIEEEEMELKEEAVTGRSAGATAIKKEQAPRLDEQVMPNEPSIMDSFSPTANPKPSLGQYTPRKISGLVTNPSGEPIMGVQVGVPNSSIATLTGLDGKYTLSLDRNSSELQFSSLGFQQTKVPLPNIDTYDIRLAPALDINFLSTSETTVARNRSRKARKQNSTDIKSQVTAKAMALEDLNAVGVFPVGGTARLNRTIRNMANGVEVHYSQLGQAVSLTFNVAPGNKIENIRIVESKGLVLDQEAIRLIRLSKWELERAYQTKGATVYCKVKF